MELMPNNRRGTLVGVRSAHTHMQTQHELLEVECFWRTSVCVLLRYYRAQAVMPWLDATTIIPAPFIHLAATSTLDYKPRS